MTFDIIKAIILGVVEGLTEFIPVSSTGHLLLMQRFFGFGDDDFGKSFAVLIQFGAILALLSIYSVRLWQLFIGMFNSPQARRFILGVLIAFSAGGGDRGLGLQADQGSSCSTPGSCASRSSSAVRSCSGWTGSI